MDLVAQNVIFFAIAAMMIVAAVRVVTTSNIVHAALWLILVLAGAAGQYILLIAEFTAVVQVLVYIGAIVVLFLFGIMLTRAPLGNSLETDRKQVVMGAVVAIPLAALLGFTLLDSFSDTELDFDAAAVEVQAADEVAEPGSEAPEAGDDPAAQITEGRTSQVGLVDANGSNSKVVSDSIFGDYLIAFEAISVLLLAALIGAVVLARRD
jgi:NADH-quinone oxidoreductase subunit J